MKQMWLLAVLAAVTACSQDSGIDTSVSPSGTSSSSSSSSSAASSSSTSSSSSSATSSGSTDAPGKPVAAYLLPGAVCSEYPDRNGFDIVYRCDLSSEPNGVITLVEAEEGSPEVERVFRLHYEESYQLTERDGDESLIIRLGYAEGDGALEYVMHQDLYYLLSGELVLLAAIRAPVDATKHVQIGSVLVHDPEPAVDYTYSAYDYHQPWEAVGFNQYLVADHHMQDLERDGTCEVYSTTYSTPSQDPGQDSVGSTDPAYCNFTPATAPIDAPVIAPEETFVFKKYGPPSPAEVITP